MKVVMIAVLGFITNTALASTEAGACLFSSIKICVESSVDVGSPTDCAQQGGTFIQACPTENRYGSCAITQDGNTFNVRYYNGTPVEPENNCAENGGQFTRN